MDSRFTLDTSSFDKALQAYFSNSRRSLPIVLQQQAKSIIKQAMLMTPPGGNGRTFQQGRRAGIKRIEFDVRKLVRPTTSKNVDHKDPAILIENNRVQGRVAKVITPRLRVDSRLVRAYIERKKKRVGFLQSGWNTAANKLGFKPPGFVSALSGTGAYSLTSDDSKIVIKMTNSVKYAGQIRVLSARLQKALDIQAARLTRQVANHQQKQAERSGFK